MSIVRLIYVTVKPDQVKQAIDLWKNHCAPTVVQNRFQKILRLGVR